MIPYLACRFQEQQTSDVQIIPFLALEAQDSIPCSQIICCTTGWFFLVTIVVRLPHALEVRNEVGQLFLSRKFIPFLPSFYHPAKTHSCHSFQFSNINKNIIKHQLLIFVKIFNPTHQARKNPSISMAPWHCQQSRLSSSAWGPSVPRTAP